MSRIMRSIFASFKRISINKHAKENLVGSDHLGNKYYERPADPSQNLKQLRRVEPVTVDPTIVPEVPAEWMTWLQERRQHPPTPEEVLKIQHTMQRTLQRAGELERVREEEDIKAGIKSEPESSNPTGLNFPTYDDYTQLNSYNTPNEDAEQRDKSKK